MDVAPEQRTHVVVAVQHLEQRLGVAQTDAIHPAAADGHRMVVQTDQMVMIRRLAQRPLKQVELVAAQHAEYRTGNQGIEHHHTPAADFQHRLHQRTTTGSLTHGTEFVMIAGAPARGASIRSVS